VTGWYKSHTIVTLRIVAVAVTLFFNIDSVYLARQIYTNSQLRGSLVTLSERIADHPETVTQFYTQSFEQTTRNLDSSYQRRLAAATDSQRQVLQRDWAAEKSKAADEYTQKRLHAMDSLTRMVSDTALPIGWKKSVSESIDDLEKRGWPWVLLGWLITAGCLSMGAPFWFDLLVKIVNVRRAGIKPTSTDKRN
jgi:hypothetical protein